MSNYDGTIEGRWAAERAMTFEQWKEKGERLYARYWESTKVGKPYEGMTKQEIELLEKYAEWSSGVIL